MVGSFTPYDYARLAGLGGKGVSAIARGYNQFIGQRQPFRGPGSNTQVIRKKKKSRMSGRGTSFAQRVRNLGGYKHNTQADGTVTAALTHGSIYTSGMTQKIAQGDGNGERTGDSVYLVALKVQGAIHSAAAVTGANMYRIIVCWSGEEYNVTGSTSGLTYAEMFHPNANTFACNAIVNSKAITVLYDEMVTINSLLTTTAEAVQINFKVPLNQRFSYQAAGSTMGKVKNLYVVVIGSIVGGSGSVGNFFFNTDLIFQD